MSEAEFDQMTDKVADGAASEGELIEAWRAPVLAAHRKAAAPAARDDDTASRSTVTRVVRYSGMPSSAEAVSMSLHGHEVGHRSMRRFYRQRFKPSSTSLGAANPGLQALMQQYSKAGVLSTHVWEGPPGAGKRSEVSKVQQHAEAKLFVKTGMSNNKTLTKHYKNQSLCF